MPTKFEGDAREVRALDAYIKLSRASGTVDGRLATNLARLGLTTGQLGVMEALMHLGPLSQGELGHKLLRSAGNVTTVIDNLERRKLVTRRRNREDRRVVTVDLTKPGRRLIEKAFPVHARAVARVMETLTAAEQEELGRLCRKLGRGVPRELGTDRTMKGSASRLSSASTLKITRFDGLHPATLAKRVKDGARANA
jgi:MarR family 2-MHQ and catechol resistance regulon transcriptional repressor